MNELVPYAEIVEEIKATIVEGVYRSRQELLETYHDVGRLISTNQLDAKQVAIDAGLSQRTLERAVQFYETIPDLTVLPKNSSWHKVVNELLPRHKEVGECEHVFVYKCSKCGKFHDDL